MNVETIKTELQQVLDSDLALRKEYNELKRSLSDYRNQLIERDEDCKRLQVSIDVLNTKLVVADRDNTNFKSEIAGFKELRQTIREQLQEKQDEITGLLSKIEDLQSQLGSVSSEYETKIADIQSASSAEISQITQAYEVQLAELRTNTSYQQNGIKSEFEAKISQLTASYESQLEEMKTSGESRISELTSGYEAQISALKNESELAIQQVSSSASKEVDDLRAEYEQKIAYIEKTFSTEKEQLVSAGEVQIAELTNAFSIEKSELIASFEKRIEFLSGQLQSQETTLSSESESRIQVISNNFREKENELKAYYEDKLANTLIHSNAQNTKLTEELNKFVLENEHFKEKIREMVYHIDAQNTQIEKLSRDAEIKGEELGKQAERYNTLSLEFEAYKATQQLSAGEIVSGLNTRIAELTTLLSEKDTDISALHTSLEDKTGTFNTLTASYQALQESFDHLSASIGEKEEQFEAFKNELELNHSQSLQSREVEFQKLLAENTNLISEIDNTSDRLEAAEAELGILRAELQEMKATSEGKTEDLKETLSSKNYELTALAANNSALQTEIALLKSELSQVKGELNVAVAANEEALKQQDEMHRLTIATAELESQLSQRQADIEQLNARVLELTGHINGYQEEIATLKSSSGSEEREAFIDSLFKQVDMLNDERFRLLSEKEEMASQLLKMNDSLSGLSQQVDAQNIDISELDMHRKNVILAKSSNGTVSQEKTAMKKQINELVREIDKCIALLSA